MQVMKHAIEGIHRGFESQGRLHQKFIRDKGNSGSIKRIDDLQKIFKNV